MGFLATRPGKRVFVSWTKHSTRSASFAQAVGATPHWYNQGGRLGPLKYVIRGTLMLSMLLRERPSVVFCMNPPPFIALTAWLYTLFFNAKFTLDSHTGAFDRKRWVMLTPLHRFAARRAAFSTVTNQELATRIESMGGKAVVVPDIPYTMPEGEYAVAKNRFTVAFICTYCDDEPVIDMLKAAKLVPNVQFYVTGDTRKVTPEMEAARGDNVLFTGYLSNEAYAGLLRSVDAILVLTLFDFTMQRGGSEAVTLGKPLITSDQSTLRRIFHLGAVHIPNTPEGIKSGVETVRADLPRYQREILELKEERQQRWNRIHDELESLLASRPAKQSPHQAV